MNQIKGTEISNHNQIQNLTSALKSINQSLQCMLFGFKAIEKNYNISKKLSDEVVDYLKIRSSVFVNCDNYLNGHSMEHISRLATLTPVFLYTGIYYYDVLAEFNEQINNSIAYIQSLGSEENMRLLYPYLDLITTARQKNCVNVSSNDTVTWSVSTVNMKLLGFSIHFDSKRFTWTEKLISTVINTSATLIVENAYSINHNNISKFKAQIHNVIQIISNLAKKNNNRTKVVVKINLFEKFWKYSRISEEYMTYIEHVVGFLSGDKIISAVVINFHKVDDYFFIYVSDLFDSLRAINYTTHVCFYFNCVFAKLLCF